jgi:RND superfamily putative drug exporter
MTKKTKKTVRPSARIRLIAPLMIVFLWLGAAGIGGPYFGKIEDVSTNDLTSFLPESADSTKVAEQINKYTDDSTVPLSLVFTDKSNDLKDTQIDTLKDLSELFGTLNGVQGEVSPPIVSDDEKAAIITIPLDSEIEYSDTIEQIKEKADQEKGDLSFVTTGPAAYTADLQDAFAGIDGILLLVALSVVLVILFFVYRSPILPVVTLLGALSALSAAVWIVWHFADAGILDLNGQVQGILFILVIGAATDYSLLYIARYREELTIHRKAWDATKSAWKSSFEPILAAGGTVTVGLMCLLLSDLGSNKSLGPVAGIGIILAVLVALTFLPALLLMIGRNVFWPRVPKFLSHDTPKEYMSRHPAWAKIGAFVRLHPRRIWVACVIFLFAACLALPQLNADGVAQSDLILGKSDAREGQKVVDEHFAAGSGSPTFVIARDDVAKDVVQVLEEDRGVDQTYVAATGVGSGRKPLGSAAAEIRNEIRTEVKKERTAQLKKIRKSITSQLRGAPSAVIENAYTQASNNVPGVKELTDKAYPFSDAKPKTVDGSSLYYVTLTDASDSISARDTVSRLRTSLESVDSTVLVGGFSAAQLDTNTASERDVMVVLPVILLAITIILMLLLRAIIGPIVLLLTTVVSFGATLGISALLFNNVWHFPGADPSVIIFGFVFLVALGIDYNIFLMTRVREETARLGVNKGTIKALVVTGGVITSAGIVLASTFAALSVIPILFLAQIAFIVSFGVLLDTLLVRSLLVPALTLEIGRLMWWPSKLYKKGKK